MQNLETGLLILGDHLPDPETGRSIPEAARLRQIVEIAVNAEAAGFGSVWLGEHHFCRYVISSPAVMLAAIGARTRRLRLGTAVTLLPTLDPVRVAEDFATLDALTEGRSELVVGRGILRILYGLFGHDLKDSRDIFEDHLDLLLALWTQTSVEYPGRFRPALPGVAVYPRPVQQPHPPIWVGSGSSRRSIDLAARLGLSLMLPSILGPVDTYIPYIDRYRRLFNEAGHAGRRPRVGAASHVHVARDSQTARARWRPYHSQYLKWVHEELLPWGQLNVQAAGAPDGMTYDDVIRDSALCGSPAEVVDRILGLRERLGLELHMSMIDHGGIPDPILSDCMELFSTQVLPHLNRATSSRSET